MHAKPILRPIIVHRFSIRVNSVISPTDIPSQVKLRHPSVKEPDCVPTRAKKRNLAKNKSQVI